MKIRNGFVSNSSSSSFVVFGRMATLADIDDPRVKFFGYEGSEGYHFFRPNQEIINYIKTCSHELECEFILEYFSFCEDETISVSELQKKISEIHEKDVMVKCFEIDHWEINDLGEFIQCYGTDEDRENM